MAFFEIGIYQVKSPANLGTLWRSAYQMGASGIFTIGHRYKSQPSDPYKAQRHIPLRAFEDFDKFMAQRPEGCVLVAIEEGGTPLSQFDHPPQAIYLLGSEDKGLPESVLQKCNAIVSLESVRRPSYNVSVTGSIVMYDRVFGTGASKKINKK